MEYALATPALWIREPCEYPLAMHRPILPLQSEIPIAWIREFLQRGMRVHPCLQNIK